MKANLKAFTLIELLVVIAIIAILAAILFPVFASAKLAAKNTACQSNARQCAMAVTMYLSDNDDTMPLFYAYNSQPPSGQTGHKGVELELLPYTKNKEVFKSPLDSGGPFLKIDVPGASTYHAAYGSSYRFTHCLFSVAAGESSQNNNVYTTTAIVNYGAIVSPSESRAMRAEMFPFFARQFDTTCMRYGYDCDAPNNYYQEWSPTGGSMIFCDGHAKFITSAGAFDNAIVDPDGHRSGEASTDPNAWTGTWYSLCD
jgi:prepilin-type N-terminal cleavage/methylation domain-containing protein